MNVECLISSLLTLQIACCLCVFFPSHLLQGDSGGPLIAQRDDKLYELVGVVSWGKISNWIEEPSAFNYY